MFTVFIDREGGAGRWSTSEKEKMAFFDDKRMLLSHIRHSFVVSDDTGKYIVVFGLLFCYTRSMYYIQCAGMCELIMVKEDVEQEIENDHSFHKKSVRMRER